MSTSGIETIVFDLGGVMIDWNPRHLYRKLFKDEETMEFFLSNVCNHHWNEQQDAGRPFAEACELLAKEYPQWTQEIMAFHKRWPEMIGGPIQETVAIFQQLRQEGRHRILALTNWSAETFPIAQAMFDFLADFEGILVSGEEKMKKPDAEIYLRLLDKFAFKPETALFIDDSKPNIESAKVLGFQTIHFINPEQLKSELQKLKVFG